MTALGPGPRHPVRTGHLRHPDLGRGLPVQAELDQPAQQLPALPDDQQLHRIQRHRPARLDGEPGQPGRQRPQPRQHRLRASRQLIQPVLFHLRLPFRGPDVATSGPYGTEASLTPSHAATRTMDRKPRQTRTHSKRAAHCLYRSPRPQAIATAAIPEGLRVPGRGRRFVTTRPGLTATMEHRCRPDSHDVPSLSLLPGPWRDPGPWRWSPGRRGGGREGSGGSMMSRGGSGRLWVRGQSCKLTGCVTVRHGESFPPEASGPRARGKDCHARWVAFAARPAQPAVPEARGQTPPGRGRVRHPARRPGGHRPGARPARLGRR